MEDSIKMNAKGQTQVSEDLLDDDNRILEELEAEAAKESRGFITKLLVGGFHRLAGLFPKKKWIWMGVAALVLLGLAGGVGYFVFTPGAEEVDPPPDPAQEAVEAPAVSQPIFEDIILLEPFGQIRLAGGSAMKFASVEISLELMDVEFRRQVFSKTDRIREIVLSQFGEMPWMDLRSTGGKIRVKYELLRRINAVFPRPMVRNLYFTNFIMQ